MGKSKLSIITQNFNSSRYLPISMLSLYSAFKTLAELKDYIEGRILLIDSASSDGSYEKLHQLGLKLSKETSINFECRRLNKDLGNSFAITYGFLLEKKRGSNYLLNMDNDFIILYSNTIKEMIDLAEKFDWLKIKYHSISSMHMIGNREFLLAKLSHDDEKDLDEIANLVYEEAKHSDLLGPNVNYVNTLNQSFMILPVISREEFDSIIREIENPPRFLISSHVPASCALYNPNTAPMHPYFYIHGDDISSGLENAKRGYINVVLTKIGGIHYATTSQKANNIRLYFTLRNNVLCNPSTGSRRALHKFISLTYSVPYTMIVALNIKQLVKRKLLRNELLEKSSSGMELDPHIAKYIVLGVLHGIMKDHYFRREIKQWFEKFTLDAGVDYLDYLRLDFSTWSGSSLSPKDIILYLTMPDKVIRKNVGLTILKRRLKKYGCSS